MGWIHRLLEGDGLRASYPPDHDFWYQPAGSGSVTMSGLRIDPAQAQLVSAWYRGRDILSTSLAMLPLNLYERIGDEGREVARRQALHDIIHRKPNVYQDAFQWKRQQMGFLIDDGNAYNRIVPGARGFVDQLIPIHYSQVRPEQLDSGRIVYHVQRKDGTTTVKTQDEIFHLRAASEDGVKGVGVLRWARESLGTALATEAYAGSIYSRGALHSGTISGPGVLNEESAKRMARSWMDSTAGAKNWHMPAVLEMDYKFEPNTMTPEQAQMLLSRKYSVNDIARWLGLPPHMLGDLERSTNNNIEHQGQEFVTYSLGSWLSLFEFAISDQLVIDPETYYAEFVRDALVRGDIAARWTAYMQAITTGTYTRNEVRVMENKNKLPGLDKPLDPAHLTGKGGADNAPKSSTKAEAIAVEAAARLLRKEITAMQKAAVKHAADQDAFAVFVTEFYAGHIELVQHTLQMTLDQAQSYCWGQAHQILNGPGIAALETWNTGAYAAGLAALALEETAA